MAPFPPSRPSHDRCPEPARRAPSPPHPREPGVLSAPDARARLLQGNAAFAERVDAGRALGRPTAELVLDGPQRPFALVLGCADARVPVELVFNQNLGDLFVVRVAGHAVGPAVLASVEYAVAALQVPLIVVLGHSGCGAVQATLDAISGAATPATPALAGLVAQLRPGLEPLTQHCAAAELGAAAVRANVAAAVASLRAESALLLAEEQAGHLQIVGAVYDMASGRVRFGDEAVTTPAPLAGRD